MRKLLLNFTVAITITSSAIPVSACTFNFYVDRSKDKIKELIANETSNIVKSLALSNNLGFETNQTINDMFSNEPQNNIINQSADANNTINNWGDFTKYWGVNGKIETNGFDQDKTIVAKGQSNLTNNVNNKISLDNTLDDFSFVNSLNVITNSVAYAELIAPGAILKNDIVRYLTMLQHPDQLPPSIKSYWPLISNLINHFQDSFLTPISSLLTDLTDGWKDLPTNIHGLKTYMENWKDGNQPYSQWVENGKWTLNTATMPNWKGNDFTLYRSGTFLNYLFKKIGSDNGLPSEYLGQLISKNIDDPMSALKPYTDLLTSNPAYILMIINGFLPVIKDTILQMNDISQGVKHLTIGKDYPTKTDDNSWNLLDILNTIKTLINNPDDIKNMVDKLLKSAFLYDIQITYKGVITLPLPEALGVVPDTKTKLETTITNLVTGNKFKNIFNSIYEMIDKLNNQFPSGDGGIDLNLEALTSLLVAKDHGLLTQLNTVAETLATIIKPDHAIHDADLNTLYTSLGGQVPEQGKLAPEDFIKDSILDILRNQFTSPNTPLQTLIKFIYNSDKNHQGIAQFLIANNKKWIQDNYTSYLDIDGKNSNITNINFQTSTIDKNEIINLSYRLTFKVKDKTFTCFVSGIAQDNITTYQGTHNFKFTEIDLIS